MRWLGEASQGWSVEARRALWRQVAGLAVPVKRKRRDLLRPPDRRLRARAWEQLAELEAGGAGGAASAQGWLPVGGSRG